MKRSISILLLSSLLGFHAFAETRQLSYGGRLSEASGKPIAGPVDLEVSFYRSATDTNKLSGKSLSFLSVPLKAGVFAIDIKVSAADFHTIFPSYDDEVWIEVKDLTHSKNYPRQRFAKQPMAARTATDGKTTRYNSDGLLSAVPESAATAGQFLTKDASGNMVWALPPSAGTTLQGQTVGNSTPSAGDILRYDGTKWVNQALPSLGGNISQIAGTAPVLVTNPTSNASASMAAASSVSDGYLSSADWISFAAKQDLIPYSPANKAGDTMSGHLNMGTNAITNLAAPTNAQDLTRKAYADSATASLLKRDGSTPLTQNWAAGNFDILSIDELSSGSLTSTAKNGLKLKPHGSNAGETGELRFMELSTIEKNYVGFKAPNNVTTSTVFTLPAADGSSGQILSTNGAGQLLWANPLQPNVQSVNGQAPTVILDADSVAEGSKLYYTDARAKAAVVANTIANAGTKAASQNAIYDALQAKADSSSLGTIAARNAIASSDITDATIVDADISASAAIEDSKLATISTAGKVSDTAVSANVTILGADVDLGSSEVTGTLPISKGGTGVADTPANGEILVGKSGAYDTASLTAGSGITVTNGAGSISIATTTDLSGRLNKSGGTMSGGLNMNGQGITNSASPSADDHMASKSSVDAAFAARIKHDGSTPLTGAWAVGSQDITNVGSLSASGVTTSGAAAIKLEPWASGTGEMRFQAHDNGGYTVLKAPAALAASKTFTLPDADAVDGQLLKTDGSGNLGWSAQTAIPVSSVQGQTGAVTLTSDQVAEGTNLYFTAARAKAAAVADAITDDVTDVAPSQNKVFDALALKQNTSALGTLHTKSAVNSADIDNGTLVNDDFSASAAIPDSKLATIATAGKVSDTALAGTVTKLGQTIELNGAEVTGVLPASKGGRGLSSTPANGALLIGNGTDYTSATLTQGSGVSISNGAGTITITSTDNASTKVARGGDTMSNTLNLASNGLKIGTDQLTMSSGTIGVGTATPSTTTMLDARESNGIVQFARSYGTGTMGGGPYTEGGAIYFGGDIGATPTPSNASGVIETGLKSGAYHLAMGTPYGNKAQMWFDSTGKITFLNNGNYTYLEADGRMAIGGQTPKADIALAFPDNTGTKMSLFDAGQPLPYGLGYSANSLDVHTDNTGANLTFGSGSHSSYTEHIRLKGTGQLGIGSNNPSEKLVLVTSTGNDGMRIQGSNDRWLFFAINNSLDNYNYNVMPNDRGLFWGTSNAGTTDALTIGPWSTSNNGIRITHDGKVSIGNNPIPTHGLTIFEGGLHIEDAAAPTLGIGFGTCPLASCDGFAYETIQMASNKNLHVWFGGSKRYEFKNGGEAQKAAATDWSSISDLRLKDVRRPWTLGLKEVLQLDPVYFSYKKDNARRYDSKPVYSGFMAQDVQKVIPEAIDMAEDGYLRLTPDSIHWSMLNAVIEEEKERLAAQEALAKEGEAASRKYEKAEAEAKTLSEESKDMDADLARAKARIKALKDKVDAK